MTDKKYGCTGSPLIINIIHFIRASEPRRDMDLVEPVLRQTELIARHGFPCTWLLQYDALTTGPYVEILKDLCNAVPSQQIGGWFEIVRPLAEKAGLPWRGRHSWDWHSHVGFSIGYTPADRERLIDAYMDTFASVFGFIPATMGAWVMDAHSLAYMHGRYGVAGACNCKDQHGTDGYTLWGGYWNQAYYPSRFNAFMPAQNEAAQVPLPVFRMLGPDPVDQYDAGCYAGTNCAGVSAQGVVSLEPAYKEGGGNPDWVRWYFDALAGNPSLAYQYVQAGQENSFGWPGMKSGYIDQLRYFSELSRQIPELRIETLETTARWFRNTFALTPPTSVSALRDSRGRERGSVWYNSRFYRCNVYWDETAIRLRDLHRFDETYRERYLDTVCPSAASTYDTLPLCEGFLWSDEDTGSGFVLTENGGPVRPGTPELSDRGGGVLEIAWNDCGVTAVCSESGMTWHIPHPGAAFICPWGAAKQVPFRDVNGQVLRCSHEGHDYTLTVAQGAVLLDPDERNITLRPVGGRIVLAFN